MIVRRRADGLLTAWSSLIAHQVTEKGRRRSAICRSSSGLYNGRGKIVAILVKFDMDSLFKTRLTNPLILLIFVTSSRLAQSAIVLIQVSQESGNGKIGEGESSLGYCQSSYIKCVVRYRRQSMTLACLGKRVLIVQRRNLMAAKEIHQMQFTVR
jgi:hypothetical protein